MYLFIFSKFDTVFGPSVAPGSSAAVGLLLRGSTGCWFTDALG